MPLFLSTARVTMAAAARPFAAARIGSRRAAGSVAAATRFDETSKKTGTGTYALSKVRAKRPQYSIIRSYSPEIPVGSTLTPGEKVKAPSMVYIAGEEMTHYASQLCLKHWIEPYFDTSTWEYFDLSCKNRDATDDKVLADAVEAGKRIGAIFKEPTITPTAVQVEEMGLSKSFGSPNGAMRRGWNGVTISRDTIHIEGVKLGFKKPVIFERHAVGGEYGAGFSEMGKGTLVTTFHPDDGGDPSIVDSRKLDNDHNVAVVYHNPYDNVEDLAHIFFERCLEAKVVPYVVTKKTVFKWQEGFWTTMQSVFNEHYKENFLEAGLLEKTGGELQHLISDAATMQIIRWTDGGFGMAAHNYDGDMLTDEIAQVHRSPGFITSNLVGRREDGKLIKEFEASHGTVTDLWHDHLAGRETSFNPLGLAEAMIGAMQHSAVLQRDLHPGDEEKDLVNRKVLNFTNTLREAMHATFRYGQGTRDLCGPSGYTTEDFVSKVAWRLDRYIALQEEEPPVPEPWEPDIEWRRSNDVDMDAVKELFSKYDVDKNGSIEMNEFARMLVKLGIAPQLSDKDTKEKVADV
mmetsp:Transcript_16648/g.37423  ORF Transcript_16648/g.37423 Transcript_16648/m.37423 type:complete len:574 (-) Transcript_16648:173-1894(-)